MDLTERLYFEPRDCPVISLTGGYMSDEQETVYTLIGGEKTIKTLVDTFYAKVEADEHLRGVFPDDLEPGKRWQYLFLMQLFGGPSTYNDERGHPRLRMRHMPFPIDAEAGRLWLQYMLESLDEVGIEEPARTTMRQYFQRAAPHMINIHSPGDDIHYE